MNKKKIKLGALLMLLGIIGIATMLTTEMPLPAEVEVALKDKFSPEQIKLLILINPTIMLLVAVIVGLFLFEKVNLKVPVLEKITGINDSSIDMVGILKYGIFGGLLAGALLSIVGLIYTPSLPTEFIELGEKFKPSLASRFLYGGLTEEILMRFGLMTLVVWIFSKIFKEKKPIVYWIGILIAAIIFAIGHFPMAYQAISNPSFSLLTYILIGNLLGGIVFGWLYWKKGLESAFIAHIFAHLVMVISNSILN